MMFYPPLQKRPERTEANRYCGYAAIYQQPVIDDEGGQVAKRLFFCVKVFMRMSTG